MPTTIQDPTYGTLYNHNGAWFTVAGEQVTPSQSPSDASNFSGNGTVTETVTLPNGTVLPRSHPAAQAYLAQLAAAGGGDDGGGDTGGDEPIVLRTSQTIDENGDIIEKIVDQYGTVHETRNLGRPQDNSNPAISGKPVQPTNEGFIRPAPPRPTAEQALEAEPGLFQNRGGFRAEVEGDLLNPFEDDARAPFSGTTQRLTQSLEDRLAGLEFDPNAERDARTSIIDRTADQERERIGRTFALDPAGLQQGRAIRVAGTLGAARLNALDQLEADLGQRTFNNRATATQLTNQALTGREGADLGSRGLGLQATGQAANFLQGRDTLNLQEAQLFGGTPDQVLTLDDLSGAFNSQRGDQNYNDKVDFNRDGRVDYTDQLMFTNRAQDGRIVTPGRRTLGGQQVDSDIANTSRALGIEEERLSAGISQFEQQLAESARTFNASFTGYLFDTQGRPSHMIDPTTGTPRPISGIQREAFEQQKEAFNNAQDLTAEKFFEQVGLGPLYKKWKENPEDLTEDDKATLLTVSQLLVAVQTQTNVGGFAGQVQQQPSNTPAYVNAAGQVVGSIIDAFVNRKKKDE